MADGFSHSADPTAASVEGLSLSFPSQQKPLFDGLSVNVRRGQKTLLLGVSGSGKSTLLSVLTGLIPDAIQIPAQWKSRKTFTSWGYVFQNPDAQFCMPYVDEEIAFVLENLGIPRSEMDESIQSHLALTGLSGITPHQKISTLSQGQKQRLALASTLAMEPDTLVLDEPSALLDPKGTKKIWQTIREISRDKTLLIVEHNIEEVIHFVDRVLVLDSNGQLIIDDTPQKVQADYRVLLNKYGIWHSASWPGYDKRADYCEQSNNNFISAEQEAVLEIDHLKGSYDDSAKVVMSEQKVYPGEWVVLTGPNGAGKSTLLMAIMQLIKQEGKVYLSENLIKNTEQVAAEVGFLFQNPELQFVEPKVRDEVAFTLRQQAPWLDETKVHQRVDNMLQNFGLKKYEDQNPHQLSTGQKRRLSVAATTVKDRSLLLLDEPTFGQDAVNTFEILEQLEVCRRKGTAILMVTHDMNIVQRFATRRWKLKNGRIQEDINLQQSPITKKEPRHVV